MAGVWVDYREVKSKVSMQMVLDRYGVTGLKALGDNLRGKCPIHQGDGQRAFQVSLSKNIFHCFSCKAGGNVLDLVAKLEQCSVRDAAVKLQEWFLLGEKKESTLAETDQSKVDPVSSVREDDRPDKQSINPTLSFQLRVDSSCEYGKKRGLTQEIILAFGCGLCLSKGMFANRYVIPLHNPAGELVGYAGRALEEGIEPRYLFPSSDKGFYKSHLLFNLHRLIASNPAPDTVVVVEGFFSVMWLTQLGYASMGLLGSSVSEEQEKLLFRHFQKVILMLDADEAGRKGIEDCLASLAQRVFVKVVSLPEEKQPDKLTKQQVDFLLTRE